VGADALLEPLTQRDTHVYTIAPSADSPAIDSGTTGVAGSVVDATGTARGEFPDIGAHEVQFATEYTFWTQSDGSIYRGDLESGDLQQTDRSRSPC